jgi:cell division transport system ATP-binding protein
MIKFVDITKVYDNNTLALKNLSLTNNPSILIADEPTGNLDPETAMGIMETLNNINKNGTTILMATHAKEIVNTMRKRVIAIEGGSIVRDEIKGAYDYET